MMALIIGTILAIGALAVILYPIFYASSSHDSRSPQPKGFDTAHGSERQTAVEALREIEFDRATGKLSDDDYANLHARYTSDAITEMRDRDAAAASGARVPGEAPPLDEAEALISRFRSAALACGTCGPRPEPDAVYCSNCGRFLAGSCSQCGHTASEPGAQFCSSCGARLAA